MKFTAEDYKQLKSKGITEDTVLQQLKHFKEGFPFLNLDRAVTLRDGIIKFTEEEILLFKDFFLYLKSNYKLLKFVPASGAATRMFKDLYDFLQSEGDHQSETVKVFFENIEKFAFYEDLEEILIAKNIKRTDYKKIIAALLLPEGLNYGNMPKAALPFHISRSEAFPLTPVETHIVEAMYYAFGKNDKAHVHFTTSAEHQKYFDYIITYNETVVYRTFKNQIVISFSHQKPSTDTIAVDGNNNPIRTQDGSLLFRPGGHGALLENLNEVDADIIFIKNIDNVQNNDFDLKSMHYKAALCGYGIQIHEEITKSCNALKENTVDDEMLKNIFRILSVYTSFQVPADASSWDKQTLYSYLFKILNRPLRVCGMVCNEGQVGGGPFWVKRKDGAIAGQIVEQPQIDISNHQQREILENSTHFNPVDLVCFVKDYQGNRFNLMDFRDENTGFISKKSKDGIELKALELPGLWNGAMSEWNTAFVEVPKETFAPVKTVNDLLKACHQGKKS